MNTFRRRSVATALVVSLALLPPGCASWHARNARNGSSAQLPAQADTTGARAAMVGQLQERDGGGGAITLMAVCAVVAGILGWTAQNSVYIPEEGPKTEEEMYLKEQRDLTRAAWICLSAGGLVTLLVEVAHSMKPKGAAASAEPGATNDR